MNINGLKLPDAFVALIDRPKPIVWWEPKVDRQRWIYKGGKDGVYWLPEGTPDHHQSLGTLLLHESLVRVETESDRLPIAFHIFEYTDEEIDEWNAEYAHLPGFLPFITDFSQLLDFGRSDCDEPFCFDYRDNQDEPSIIHWDDANWRRFAPNFDTFISWYKPLGRLNKSRSGDG